jgi:type IV pilus assembly protein PilE
MITVAILTIVAAIAFPNYRNYVMRSHRGDATQALLRLAAAQEKFYITNNRYASELGDGGLGMDTRSENGWYDLSITSGDVTGFTARAVPVADGGQADDDACQRFEIDATGRKSAFGEGDVVNDDVCWR